MTGSEPSEACNCIRRSRVLLQASEQSQVVLSPKIVRLDMFLIVDSIAQLMHYKSAISSRVLQDHGIWAIIQCTSMTLWELAIGGVIAILLTVCVTRSLTDE